MALGFFEDADDLLITWTWNGRSDRAGARRVGLLLRDLPILQRLSDTLPIAALMRETAGQQNRGIAEGGTAFIGDLSDDAARRAAARLPAAALCFTYHDYLDGLRDEAPLSAYRLLPDPAAEAEDPLQLHIRAQSGACQAELLYDSSLYTPGRMRAFLALYAEILRRLCASDAPETVGALRRALAPEKTRH